MTEVMTAPALMAGRKCKFEEMFDTSFIELIRLVPRNPHVRALILRYAGKMPGADCGTFDQVKEWIELNCNPRVRPMSHRNRHRSIDDGIAIEVEFSETEYGRANYSVPRSGTEQFLIGAEDLLEIVRDAIESGGGMDEIVESISTKIDDDAWNQCDPSMDDYGDYDYDEHESHDSSGCETTYNHNEIRTAVRVFLEAHHPALAGEL